MKKWDSVVDSSRELVAVLDMLAGREGMVKHHTNCAILVTDSEGVMFDWNDNAAGLLDLRAEQAGGEPLWKHLEGGEDEWKTAANSWKEETRPVLVSLPGKEGPPLNVEMTALPRRNGNGGIIGYVVILQGISENREEPDTDSYAEKLRSLVQDRSDELILKNRELEYANRNMMRLREEMEQKHSQLKAAHEFLDNILNTIPTGVMTVSRERTITSFNKSAEQITDYSAAEVIGRKCEILQGDTRMGSCEIFNDGNARHITGKKCTIRGKGNRPIVIIKNSSLFRDLSGNVIGAVESFVDITKLDETEKKLRDADGHFRNVLSCAVDVAILITDRDGTLNSFNEGARRLFGWEPGEVVGKEIQKTLFQKDAGPSLWVSITGNAVNEGRFEGSVNYVCKDGRLLKTYLTLMPLTDADGLHYGYVGVSRVQTGGEKEYVSPVEKMAHEILMKMPEPSLMLTGKAVVCCANDSARRIFGAKPGQLWQPEFDNAEKWWNGGVFEEILSGSQKEQVTFEATVGHRSYKVTLTPVTSSDIGGTLIVTGRDITESAALNSQLIRQDKLATIGTLTAGISHEFNNILGGIMGYAGLVRQDGAYTEKLLNVLEKQGTRMVKMTQGLLDFTKKPSHSNDYAEIPEVIDEVLALVARDMEKHGIKIKRKYENVPKTLINIGQIQQVLLNLFVNARQAMGSGGVLKVCTRRERDNVLIIVSDTGRGMEPEDRARIFQPFYTIKNAEKDKRREGTGLGLSVSYNIIKKHRGSIRVESEIGKGSTFTIALPVVRDAPETAPARGHEDLVSVQQTRNARKILVVDDEAVLRSLYREILTLAGHKVVCVGEGEKAVEIIKREKYELVFLDITLPGGINGIETFKRIKQASPETKVVLSTGSLEHSHIQPYIERADAFLQKPFTMNDLLPLANEL